MISTQAQSVHIKCQWVIVLGSNKGDGERERKEKKIKEKQLGSIQISIASNAGGFWC